MQKKKTAIITARMTPENKQKIENRAADAGMTVTDYLTTCALGKKIVRVDGLDTILAELKAQGRNLNQLTVLANMGRVTVIRVDELASSYTYLCDEIYHLAQEVR
ncbi:MAG: plasmid mobilization relaxosome protein MobC [Oscillibacter sp.]|nr:plasmid mobilization relaxosome protein MobC [Oscillibacter sp.]